MLYGDFAVQIEACKKTMCQLLEQHGVSDKKVCAEIVNAFLATEQHVSADDFAALLEEKGMAINKEIAALSLGALAECGLALEIQFEGEDVKRYEHLHPHEHHDHFICLKCQKVIEFSDRQLERLQDGLIFQKGWRPLFHKLEVFGICNECAYTKQEPMPVTFVKEDTTVTLCKIKAGWGMRKRLTELGFIENEKIHVVKNASFGPLVLEVKGSRFAIGRGQAEKILVYAE